ncbi:unnamed protein product [marine sediment metagenome]|uniref:Uncharacterized protein n=1 Tax=marine sediment metagenome TaxID=412755 RepID=X1BIQ7_9ZZZZ
MQSWQGFNGVTNACPTIVDGRPGTGMIVVNKENEKVAVGSGI